MILSPTALLATDATAEKPAQLQPKDLLDQLEDSNYRKRREAFIQLCDPNVPVTQMLESESRSDDLNRSTVAKWLLKLRGTSGDTVEKFSLLVYYQRILARDYSPLYQLAWDGRWNAFVELLSLLPPNAIQELSSRNESSNVDSSETAWDTGIEMFINHAWESGNEWVVPKLLDVFAPLEQRAAINAWWRGLGMPNDWRLSEPDDPKVTLSRLEIQGKFDEALEYASKNKLRSDFERIALRNGQWEAWIKGVGDNPNAPANAQQTRFRNLALALTRHQMDVAQKEWESIRASINQQKPRGYASISLFVNDPETFARAIEALPPNKAFEILWQAGRIREAFDRVGLRELTPEACRAWASERKSMFSGGLEETPRGSISLPPIGPLVAALHHIGLKEVEQAFDDEWKKEVERRESFEGPKALLPMLSLWVTYNQREKAVAYLRSYAKKNALKLTKAIRSTNTSSDMEGRSSDFARLLSAVYTTRLSEIDFSVPNLPEPELLFAYFLEDRNKPKEPGERMEYAFSILEDLYQGRRPAHWTDNKPLDELVDILSPQSQDRSSFISGIALLYDLLGDTEEAIKLLLSAPEVPRKWKQKYDAIESMRENLKEVENLTSVQVAILSELLVKLGHPDWAAESMFRFSCHSKNINSFLLASEMLEKAGRASDLEQLRLRVLSSVSAYIDIDILRLREDDHLIRRPELKLIFDRLHRVSFRPELNDLEIRYQLAKNDLSLAPDLYRSATKQFLQLAPILSYSEESTTRFWLTRFLSALSFYAVHQKDESAITDWFEASLRIEPGNIQLPIDVLPWADKQFPKERVDEWFDLFWNQLNKHITEFPNDAMTLNNMAWLASQCNRRLDEAYELAKRATALRDDPTYLDTLADVQFQRGQIHDAIAISLRCKENQPRERQHRKQLRRFTQALKNVND